MARTPATQRVPRLAWRWRRLQEALKCLRPSFAQKQSLDALSNLITNLADPSHRFAVGILQRSIVTFPTWNDRTLISTSHRNQHMSSPCQLRRRQFRCRCPR